MNILIYGHVNFLGPIKFPTEVLMLKPAVQNENVLLMRSWTTQAQNYLRSFPRV